ncbi:MAG: dual specificity protein phosphatase family protein [Gemmataceae bacterium]
MKMFLAVIFTNFMQAELYWVDQERTLAIMPRPRAGDWLEDEIASWKQRGLEVVASLLEPDEVIELGLEAEPELCGNTGIEFLSFPIPDRGVPAAKSDFVGFVSLLKERLLVERSVGIHCRMGVGRSAVVAACLLIQRGINPNEAFATIEKARGLSVPDTEEQVDFVTQLRGAS